MKSDLDAIMQAKEVDAILVVGPAQQNPAMVYMTGGGHITTADLIKKRGQPAILFHGPMERDEAARSGLEARTYERYPYRQLLDEAGGDPLVAVALRYSRIFTDLGITEGKVALYGKVDMSSAYPVFREFEKRMPGITLVGDVRGEVLGGAMITKDEVEIDRMRQMGILTTTVVGKTADYLSSRQVRDETLLREDGEPLTIGHVKGLINLWLAELNAENPEGTIFGIGRDAGVPHSSGNSEDFIRLGQTIVYDIFPCEAGGGYHYDFTRTWCMGYASDEAQQLYEEVRSVYQTLIGELKVGEQFSSYQKRTCDLFEAMGHPTVQSKPETEEGYVHSIGHGLGLKVHERPFSSVTSLAEDILVPGAVFTIEPGLYYPSRGMGVRLEDTVAVHADGRFEILAPYPMDLVLPVKK